MQWKDTRISGLTQTSIKTQDLQLKNLITSDRGFLISGDFEQLATSYPDLINLLPNLLKDQLPSFLERLGQVDFKGNNMISNRKIDIDSKIDTNLGNVNLNVYFLNYTDQNKVSYDGRINIQ